MYSVISKAFQNYEGSLKVIVPYNGSTYSWNLYSALHIKRHLDE